MGLVTCRHPRLPTDSAEEPGVLVQGPPGTGKSQTIANLICHLLANGKRILVTSQKTPALRALKGKLPPSVADLCVLLLGEGHDQQSVLEKSVTEITNRYTSFDKSSAELKIQDLHKKLEKLRTKEAQAFETICILRAKEGDDFPARIGSYRGKLLEIARQINSEKDLFAWFTDELPRGISFLADEIPTCPISSIEALTTLSLLRRISAAEEECVHFWTPSNSDLPSPDTVGAMVELEAEALKNLEGKAAHLEHSARNVLTAQSAETLKSIADKLNEFLSLKSTLIGRASGWEAIAQQQILSGDTVVWEELLSTSEILLEQVRALLPNVARLEVRGVENRSPRAMLKDAKDLNNHISNNGKLGNFLFKPPVVKQAGYLLKDVFVDGRPCNSQESLEDLIQWLELHEAVQELEEQWKGYGSIDSATMPLNQAVGRFEQECRRLVAVMSLGEKSETITETLTCWDPGIVPEWEHSESVIALAALTEALVIEKELFQVREWFNRETKTFSAVVMSTPAAPETKKALAALQERAVDGYCAAYKEIERHNKIKDIARDRDQYVATLRTNLPRLTSNLLASVAEQGWDDLLKKIESAWNWKCAEAWLLEVSEPGAERRLQPQLKDIKKEISHTLANLATELAWKHCINKMGDANYASLRAWQNAIQQLGRGTGVYAERSRKIARDCLEKCRGVVPAWVMPIHRILDTVKPAPGAFDVIIVDEASQSGPEALFLSYLAKQMVVVGDDKQIRPETAWLDQSEVHQLQDRYLNGIPDPHIFSSTQSLFGIADVRFGNPVRLKEHFRCMPEIIGFSNRLCYQGQPLIPLRQFGGDRLEPVLKTTYVKGGFQEPGRGKVNKLEAEQLVDAIERCCEDPRYRDKSIGVISLLNTSDQDRYIEQLLVERLDPEEIQRRNIICGDAYDFQGDERDIIFLSTVSARSEGRGVRSLNDEKAQRRFNVATSRAKDQMWLFHSMNAGELGQNCLRRRLLTYMTEPQTDPLGGTVSMSLYDLHHLAKTAQRRVDRPPLPFDSWFEVDVYLAIADRQHVIVPQHEVNGYRIDMVIIGGARKLAIECDGDYWHGPEAYERDLRRQFDLERCGWEFFRVRGSSFYYDPQKALTDLWKLLSHRDFSKSTVEDNEVEEGRGIDAEELVNEAPCANEPEKQSRAAVVSRPPHEQSTSLKTKPTLGQKKTFTGNNNVPSVGNILSLTDKVLNAAIISILRERPNNSCKKEIMTTLVCQLYGVNTRGNPRVEVQRKVNGAISRLKKKKLVREYKAKNIRIQLLIAGKALSVVKGIQMNLPYDKLKQQGEINNAISSVENGELLSKAIDLLKCDQRPWSKAEILKALQVDNSLWKELSQALLSLEEVIRSGERLTTRYQYNNQTLGL